MKRKSVFLATITSIVMLTMPLSLWAEDLKGGGATALPYPLGYRAHSCFGYGV